MLENLTHLFVFVDDFCNVCEEALNEYAEKNGFTLQKNNDKWQLKKLSTSEIMTILLGFHLSGFKNFKSYYLFLLEYHRKEFPNLCSYNHFLEIEHRAIYFLKIFFECISAECDGLSYVDSTPLPVCHIKREIVCKIFKGLAKKSKSTMGWYYGFKLHLITNRYGHPISFEITKSTLDDRKVPESIFTKIFGKLYGDRGYISKEFRENLKSKMIHFICGNRTNMKSEIMTEEDNNNLKNRSIIECVFNILKNNFSMQHTRHRSGKNYVINLISSICAYCIRFVGRLPIKHLLKPIHEEKLILEGLK